MNDKTPAVFLDRDGTIIEDRGFLKHGSEAIFYDDTFRSLRLLGEHFRLFIVTNQAGIAKGAISLEDAQAVNEYVVAQLAAERITIDAVYTCPHARADGCHCAKPAPYFMRKAAEEFGLDLSRSFAVGDHPHDVDFATNAGATGIYVLTGHGQAHRDALNENAHVASGIWEATRAILDLSGISG